MKPVILLLVVATLAKVSAIREDSNCTKEFQTAIANAIEVKNNCNIQGFYDCCEAKAAGKVAHLMSSASGIYDLINVCSNDSDKEAGESIQPPMRVVCDMDTRGGGWTVIMRRKRSVLPHVNFKQAWDQYENGFGNLNTEFWLGLRNIHCLTTREEVDLMIDLRNNNGNGMTWIYHVFKVNGSDDKYRLQIGDAEGPPGGYDAMAVHNGKQFSTYDNDNDNSSKYNCANSFDGGWWFLNCYTRGSFLTGPHTHAVTWSRLLWYPGPIKTFSGNPSKLDYNYYPNVVMQIRPKRCANKCD